jgi:hypothetical protein
VEILGRKPSGKGPAEWFAGNVYFDVDAPGTESRGTSRGGDGVLVRPGDTAWCPPGEWHRHGAAPENVMSHLAIRDGPAEGQDGPETEWGEHVTEAEYGRPQR